MSYTGCCLLYIRLPVVYGAFWGDLNDLLEQVAFRILYAVITRLLVFFVGYSLGLCLGATLHACFAPGWSVWFPSIMLPALTLRHRHRAVY